MPPVRTARALAAAAALVAVGASVYACADAPHATAPATPTAAAADRAGDDQPGVHRQYGVPQRVGNGRVRTYVVLDEKAGGRATEIGVALDEDALQGLPAPTAMAGMKMNGNAHDHSGSTMYDLELPARHGTQYRFVQFDWNPAGHEPAGVYDVPHFDFHFYTISPAERDAIDPVVLGAAQFQAKADVMPPEAERRPLFVPPGAPGGPLAAVPHMGVHWVDVRAPEMQALFGKPENARPFTTTFLHGSWDGRFVFDEPMVTRAFILGRKTATSAASRDSVISLTVAQRARPAGLYPAAYHVTYDAQAKEYRIALTQLARLD